MKQTKIIMGMPISVEIVDLVSQNVFDNIFDYFKKVDEKFSTYKNNSEISLINSKKIKEKDYSKEMKEILFLSEKTKKETFGFFDINNKDKNIDPSGLVKGWAIHNASKILLDLGFKNFFVDAGGDIEAHGYNKEGKEWKIGIQNPFNTNQIVKVLSFTNKGIATSGTYLRGKHIYNPKNKNKPADDIASITVIGPNIYDADRFATAAFVMGKEGINFIEKLSQFEGYMIDKNKIATATTGFNKYISK